MWKSNHKIFIFVHVCQISRYPACVHFVDPTSSWSLLCAVLVDNSSAVHKCWIMTYYFSKIGLFHTCSIHCFCCCARQLFLWMTIWSFTDMQIPHYAVIITSLNWLWILMGGTCFVYKNRVTLWTSLWDQVIFQWHCHWTVTCHLTDWLLYHLFCDPPTSATSYSELKCLINTTVTYRTYWIYLVCIG